MIVSQIDICWSTDHKDTQIVYWDVEIVILTYSLGWKCDITLLYLLKQSRVSTQSSTMLRCKTIKSPEWCLHPGGFRTIHFFLQSANIVLLYEVRMECMHFLSQFGFHPSSPVSFCNVHVNGVGSNCLNTLFFWRLSTNHQGMNEKNKKKGYCNTYN